MNTFLLSAILLWATPPADDVRYPAKPGPRDFVLDEARLLSADDAAAVKALCDEALTKKRAPIIVVTIPSLASYGASGWPIERYAMNLMSEWGIGWEDWNYGMLLLVSPGDRKARIELGASWARRKDDDA
ncbi:MAG TPA: TPM domain-containing protein, partial [Planctomycetota bacterium]|nr:TPM domain-containing protein [Planctomycetota bacterium]